VSYSYGAESGSMPLLTDIHWVKDGSDDWVYSVAIDYESRSDLLSDASQGFEIVCADRVSLIRVYSGLEVVREYVLTYEEAATSGGFSRLEQVDQYGLGGFASGPQYEIVHSFEYSQALGVECSGADCDTPQLVSMGSVGANLESGYATLVDINGDGLPDVLDTEGTGDHRIYLNQLTYDSGVFSHGFAASSTLSATGSQMQLSSTVQTFDVDGDGDSDLLDTASGSWLPNDANGDWDALASTFDSSLGGVVGTSTIRFIDINDDKRVDLLTASDSATTNLYRNTGTTFVSESVDAIGVAFGDNQDLQFADMNGDGLNDPVELQSTGAVRYRLNLGRGHWGAWQAISGLTLTPTQRTEADWEDLNGDGVADLIVVGQTQIEYWINRNGDQFDSVVTITTTQVPGLPARGPGVSVLFADMNANGSEDVVWFSSSDVIYLEMFPRRPNLMTKVSNGIGAVQEMTYTTAAEESARAVAASNPWDYTLSIPMQLVKTVDRYVLLTGSADGSGLHEHTTLNYSDGFYDGVEKQYRGFAHEETVVAGDAFQEESRLALDFDVGRSQPHRNGLELQRTQFSDDRELSVTINQYTDCSLTGVPDPATLIGLGRKAVYHPCLEYEESVYKEGLATASAWITVRTDFTYDGYGSVALQSALGNVAVTGDELYTDTTYVTPSSRWLLGLPAVVQVYADPAGPDRTETRTYYDGVDFVGASSGEATLGFVSRVTQKVDGSSVVNSTRQRRDAYGNSVETIDPNGTVEDATIHRRSYVYDETGLFLLVTDLHSKDAANNPYLLRRESRFDRNFQKVIEATKWMRVSGGIVETSRDSDQFRYDAFGRTSAALRPGDDADKPTARYVYELGSPFSKITVSSRSVTNGSYDVETVQCLDGRGRKYQERTRLGAGSWFVGGFTAFNARGTAVQQWQSYTSTTADCELAAPAAVLSSTSKFDGLRRVIETTQPGDAIYGAPVMTRTVYLPLQTETYDGEDTVAGGAHADTPTTHTTDGLGRLISIERSSMQGGSPVRSGDRLFYDSTGTFSGYENAAGQRHELGTDLMGRTIRVTNPNFGSIDYVYDDASNIVSLTDARGVELRKAYDGLNRIVERWDAADRDGTLTTWEYDFLPTDCELTECTNVAGQLAAIRYALDLGGSSPEQGMDRFGYDVRRRSVLSARRFGSLSDLVSRVEYDNIDRTIGVVHPDGTSISYTYDAGARLTAVPGFVSSLTYDERGLLSQVALGNGATTTHGYDALKRRNRLTHVDGSGTTFHDLTYTLDRNGNYEAVADAVAGSALSSAFTLDDWYRVTAADHGDTNEAFSMDAVDRITTLNGTAVNYDANTPLAVSDFGGVTRSYDAAGGLVGRGDMDIARDELNRISRLSTAGTVTGRHLYAADARAVQMTTNGTLVLYGFNGYEIRDGVGTIFVRVGRSRAVRREQAHGHVLYGDPVEDGELNAADAYVADLAGGAYPSAEHILAGAAARMLLDQEDALAFLHADHLGSLVAATDEGGEVRGQQAFKLHGNLRQSTGFVGAYGFTGQERDATTGLVHMRYRDLDSDTGRWDCFDPAFLRLSTSYMEALGNATTGYAYVGNMGSSASDPSGLYPGKTAKRISNRLTSRRGPMGAVARAGFRYGKKVRKRTEARRARRAGAGPANNGAAAPQRDRAPTGASLASEENSPAVAAGDHVTPDGGDGKLDIKGKKEEYKIAAMEKISYFLDNPNQGDTSKDLAIAKKLDVSLRQEASLARQAVDVRKQNATEFRGNKKGAAASDVGGYQERGMTAASYYF
jgi:RHS repeat-associated protein